jgi:hypothetical protein
MKKKVLLIDGYFLAVMGTAAGVIDMVGYFTGKGPFGKIYYQNSNTIGGFEAHFLAVIIGIILIGKSKSVETGFFCKMAIAIHLVLGSSNLIWFQVFYDTNTLPMGIITTFTHFALMVFHTLAIWKKPVRSFNAGLT